MGLVRMRNSITKSTITVTILSVLSYLFGFLAQILTAHYFGTSEDVDTFVLTSVIPFFIYGMTMAIFMNAFLYIYTEHKNKHKEEDNKKIISAVFTTLLITLIVITIIILLAAPIIAKLLVLNKQQYDLKIITRMIRILAIGAFLFGMISFSTGLLYTEKKFFSPMLLRICIGTTTIIGILLARDILGIYVLPIAFVGGLFIATIVQYADLLYFGFRMHLSKEMFNSECRHILLLSIPILGSSFLYYLIQYIMNILATSFDPGSVASLHYAYVISSFPVILIGGSFATILLPSMTDYFVKQEIEQFEKFLETATLYIIYIMLPLSVVVVFFGQEITTIIYGGGMFTNDASITVAGILSIYGSGLVFSALQQVFMNTLYAMKKMKEHFFIMIIYTATIFLLSTLFIKFLGLRGLALAYVFGTVIAVGVTLYVLFKNGINIKINYMAPYITKIFCVMILLSIIFYELKTLFLQNLTGIYLFCGLVGTIVLGFLLYYMTTSFLGIKEGKAILNIIKQYFTKENF